MKLTPYNVPGNERIYPVPAVAPQYPDYYILSIGDLVARFVGEWDTIINSEIMSHPFEGNIVFPEVYSIADDGSIFKQVYSAQHVSERSRAWHPDISLIIGAAIEAIKAKGEAEHDLDLALGTLWVDVAYMADIQVRSNIPSQHVPAALSSTRRQIADLAMQFGKQLYQRLIEYGMYKHNRFPYHYVGWQDDCAIVALDAEVPDPPPGVDFTME
jgi:hypothetical protein